MKKIDKVIILGFITIFLIMCRLGVIYVSYIQKKSVIDDLMYYFSQSEVIKEHIGTVKKVNVSFLSTEWKYDKLNNNETYIKCYVVNEDNKKKMIKVIFNRVVTGGVYAFEIDDKIYYEGTKVTTSYISAIESSKVLHEYLGEYLYVYRPTNATFKKYKDNYLFCNFIIIIDNEKSKKLKVIIDKNDSDNIYAYEIDGNTLYEKSN